MGEPPRGPPPPGPQELWPLLFDTDPLIDAHGLTCSGGSLPTAGWSLFPLSPALSAVPTKHPADTESHLLKPELTAILTSVQTPALLPNFTLHSGSLGGPAGPWSWRGEEGAGRSHYLRSSQDAGASVWLLFFLCAEMLAVPGAPGRPHGPGLLQPLIPGKKQELLLPRWPQSGLNNGWAWGWRGGGSLSHLTHTRLCSRKSVKAEFHS